MLSIARPRFSVKIDSHGLEIWCGVESSLGILTGDTCYTPGQLSFWQFILFAAFVCEGLEGEISHSL